MRQTRVVVELVRRYPHVVLVAEEVDVAADRGQHVLEWFFFLLFLSFSTYEGIIARFTDPVLLWLKPKPKIWLRTVLRHRETAEEIENIGETTFFIKKTSPTLN